jgi:hypothetical protein
MLRPGEMDQEIELCGLLNSEPSELPDQILSFRAQIKGKKIRIRGKKGATSFRSHHLSPKKIFL